MNNFILNIPEFKEIFGSKSISGENLTRHILVLGETGSGKTYSVIFPVLEALKMNLGKFSALIIDPKINELKNKFMENLSRNKKRFILDLNELTEKNWKIDIFEGIRDKYLEFKLEYLYKISPRFSTQSINTNDSYWSNAVKSFISNLITIDYQLRKKGESIFIFFDKRIKDIRSYAKTYSKIPHWKLNTSLSYFKKLKYLVNWILKVHLSEERDIINYMQDVLIKHNLPEIEFWGKSATDTFSSIVSVAIPFFDDWSSDIVDKILWSHPFTPYKKNISISDAIKDKKTILYSIPSEELSEDYFRLGKIIKNKFFVFCFKTYRYRKSNNIPVFYIADEFHRFITGDEDTGEQNFLDRCRGIGVSCILATQSITSLYRGVIDNSYIGNTDSLNYSVDIILNNCCNKFFFRTTDIETNFKLKEMIPQNPYPEFRDLGHVIDVRPISSLETGECYYLISNGDWGITKINIQEKSAKVLDMNYIKRRAA